MTDPVFDRKSICIVGAGISGLTAAYALVKQGHHVTVLESELRPGGMLSSFRIGWEDLERIPHLVDPNDHALLGLMRSLGLEALVDWHEPTTALYLEGLHQPITTPMDLLRLHPVSLIRRIHAASIAWVGSLPDSLRKATSGSKNAKKPLGMFTCRIDEILPSLLFTKGTNAKVALPTEWFRSASPKRIGLPASSGRAGYPVGGFPILVHTLIKEILAGGGTLHYGCTATNVSPRDGGFRVDCVLEDCSASSVESDLVIATVSARRFAEMAAGLVMDSTYMDRLRSIRYEGHLCLTLRLKQPLSGFYRTLLPASFPFRVVTEHTRLVGLRRYGGHIVYLSRNIDTSDPLWMQSDGEIFRLFFRGLAEIHPELTRSDVKDWRLTRTRYARTSHDPEGHSEPLALETPFPGLYLAGIAQSLPPERSLDRSIRTGLTAATLATRSVPLPTEGTIPVPGRKKSEVI